MNENNNTNPTNQKTIATEELVRRLTEKTYNEKTGKMEEADGIIINAYTEAGQPGVIGISMNEKEGKVRVQVYYWDSTNEGEDPQEFYSHDIQADLAARYLNSLPTILHAKWGLEEGLGPLPKTERTPEEGNTTSDDEIEETADKLNDLLIAMENVTEANDEKRKAEAELRKATWVVEKKEKELNDLLGE